MKAVMKLMCVMMIWMFASLQMQARTYYIGESTQNVFTSSSFFATPMGGDTIKILSERRTRLQFRALEGSAQAPIVFINSGGVVKIKGGAVMPAIMFENCKYIKITGRGDAVNRYGFLLTGPSFGLSFEQFSSYCEAEYMHIDSCSLGIHAKKDFGGHPPFPYPVFTHLAVHDNFIDHCNESMYIGETKSPGMEFKHVRIYNNVITNSGREAFQIANCVDDIEAYNNFCFNSGLENSAGQLNNSQLGGNSIGRFYNNIFVKAPADGVAVFGMGDMWIKNNYFEDNQGIFADDRYIPIVNAPFRIEGNYFRNTTNPIVLSIRNSYFDLYVNNNKYNSGTTFLSANASLVKENNNNTKTTVSPLIYSVVDGVYQSDVSNSYFYTSMGPRVGLSHTFNYTPVIRYVPDIYVNTGDYQEFILVASCEDNDNVTFSIKGLPAYATLVQGPSGTAMLKIDARNQKKGVVYVTLMATDDSHGAVARQTLKIALKDPANHPVTLPNLTSVSMEAASKQNVDITGKDLDGDSIRYTLVSKPDFVDFEQTKTSATLQIKPTYLITGDYSVIIKAEDGYSDAVTDTLQIHILPATLFAGKVIYRINYGGNELEDVPLNWQKDSGSSASYESNYSAGTGSSTWTGTNTTGAPNNLFGPFRYNGVGMEDMTFEYPCQNGRYVVNLFFAERGTEVTNNQIEVFSIYLENELKEANVNIYQQAGYNALRKSFVVDVMDKKIDLKLKKILNNSKLNGVEIRYLETINYPPVVAPIDTVTLIAGRSTVVPLTITDDQFAGCTALSVLYGTQDDMVQVLKVDNAFSLVVTPNDSARGYKPFSVSVSDGCATIVQVGVWHIIPNHPNAPMLQSTTIHPFFEGEKDTLVVNYSDADGDAIHLTANNIPSFANFLDKGNGVGWLVVNPLYTHSGTYTLQVKAVDAYNLKSTNDITFEVKDASPVTRIVLNANMIHDLVQGGSVNPASLLVDEQSLDPDKKEQPVSANWKPYYTNIRAPYHIYFDLGKQYNIHKVKLHDMNNSGVLSFSTGLPDAWLDWFAYTTATYNAWVSFDTKITTKYVRLSQWNATSAEINELALYGYEVNSAPKLQTTTLPTVSLTTNDTIGIDYVDAENDAIRLEALQLPAFADFQPMQDGHAHLYLYASQKAIGTYAIVLKATDSKEYVSTDTLRFEVTKDGLNAVVAPLADTNIRVAFDRHNRILSLFAPEATVQTSIFTLNGRMVCASTERTLRLAHLSKGAYLVVVRETLTQRILHRKMVIM